MSPSRSPAWQLLGLTVLATALAFGLTRTVRLDAAPPAPAGSARIVSLSPAITETLWTIGAGAQVVGVSDYCPPSAPRVGTGFYPAYEAMARLAPTLILTDRDAGRQAELGVLAPTESLPWLSLPEVVASVRRLGALTGRAAAADALARRLASDLAGSATPAGPRVLLVQDVSPAQTGEVWFIQRGSLHGAALEAAGARNAVADAGHGAPRLGLERLLGLDPDLIIVLTTREHADVAGEFDVLRGLRAVRQRRIGVVRGPSVFATGPSILDLIPRLRAEIRRLS